MAATVVGLGDPKQIKRWASTLAQDVARESYFSSKFMGKGSTAKTPIQIFSDLESDAGDQISYDLVMQLKMQPVEGDNVLEGKEEDLKFHSDTVFIDQLRGGVNGGGTMSRKRTLHDIRELSKSGQVDWWARVFDELFFIYLSGARGTNADFCFPTTYAGFANNALQTPDAYHYVAPGSTSNSSTAASFYNNAAFDTTAGDLTLGLIDRIVALAGTMGGGIQGIPKIRKAKFGGQESFVLLISPFQAYTLRKSAASAGNWLDMQKALATSSGKDTEAFKGGIGMWNGVLVHEHQAVISFDNYGVGTNKPAARALFLGQQAGVVAFGSPGSGLRYKWNEETRDNGNQIVITTNTIFGLKKTQFNGKDFGMISVDTNNTAA
jgi:N4-gp56 family major capsid protein